MNAIVFPRDREIPAPGATLEIAPGIHWLRMPLPFALDHINLWLLEDGPGWTIVDTGLAREDTRALWRRVFALQGVGDAHGRPCGRVVVTPREEFTFFVTDDDDVVSEEALAFDRDHPFVFEGRADRRQGSVYVQDTFSLDRLTVNAGIRFDTTTVLVRDDQLSPRIGASYFLPSLEMTLRGSYNRLFMPPQVENLLLSSSEEARVLAPEGGADVFPEKQHAVEAGFMKALGAWGTLDAVYWRRNVENYADPNVFVGTTIVFPNSVAKGEASGVNVRLEVAPRRNWSGFLSYGNSLVVQRGPINGGLFLEDESGRWVAMLPGVPREMRGLLADELLPRLRERTTADRRVIRSLTLRTTGIAESQLPDLLGEHADGFGTASLAYLPGQEGVDLRLTVRDARPDDADRTLREAADALRARLGRFWYADGPTDLADVVITACRAQSLHLAVAESCTGGLLASRLTSVPGSSHAFTGGVIAYDNSVKVGQLGVDSSVIDLHGAVSEEVARAMAFGVRSLMGASIGVGITGVAGPDGGTAAKPVGLVYIAVDRGGSVAVHGGRFVGDRAEIRFRATQAALNMIRHELAPGA